MQLGIFAKTFSVIGARNSLQAVRDAGFECAQFNMACVGLPSLPKEIPAGTIDEIASASKSLGISIAAVSATYNMIHPDIAQRKDGMKKLEVMLSSAKALGTNLISLCTGTCDPHDQWRYHPDNQKPESWLILRSEMETAVALADKYDVDLGIEPELANIINSAEAAHRLLSEINSKRLHIILDPANLFEISDSEQQKEIVSKAVDQLGDRIAMAHAKDRNAQGQVVAAGNGVIDFTHFMRCLRKVGFDGPVVTHALHETEAPTVARFLRKVLDT
jgi:sugar phosphate isomerase/epimerase